MAGRRRSVRVLRVALPLVALGLMAAVFLAPWSGGNGGFSIEGVSVGADGLRLERARFTGEDAAGRPFEVNADWAVPDAPDPREVALGPLEGLVEAAGDRELSLEAGGGLLLVESERLRLEEGVTLTASDGWRVTAPRAELDLEGGAMEAEGPVEAEGPSGRLSAAKMRAERRPEGLYLRFDGGVRMRLEPAPPMEETPR